MNNSAIAVLLAAGLLLTSNGAVEASSFYAVNRLQVVALSEYEIEVIGRPGAYKSSYWCAAADFLRRNRVPWKTRVYVVSGIGRGVSTGARSAVRFTLDPQASDVEIYENNVITDILHPGYGRTLTSAWGECPLTFPKVARPWF